MGAVSAARAVKKGERKKPKFNNGRLDTHDQNDKEAIAHALEEVMINVYN